MDTKGEDKNSWFKNINKSDTGTQIYIIPVLSKTDQVVITSSSNYSNNPVMNATDNNPQTKWVSNYEMRTYKDNFYTNRNISTGSYSRGKIVDDGKNQKLFYDNQKAKETLRNKINSLQNELNKEVEIYNSQKQNIKNIPDKTQKDFMNRVVRTIRVRDYYHWWHGWRYKNVQVEEYYEDTTKYNQYLKQIKDINQTRDNIDRTINNLKNTFNIEEAKLRKQLNNIPNIDVNSLPVNITDDGKYTGDTKTTLINNSVVKGEWIDVNVPDTITINRYELLPGRRDDDIEQLTPFPRDFYLLGSNEKDKWKILDSHFNYNPTYSDNNTPISFNIENKKRYKYIRLVISSLNPAYTGFKGLGSVSLSIFNLSGNQCYSLNKTSCETFQSYINNTNMSNIEGLTMMNENINVLADLKKFNEKYSKYIKCSDITLPDNIKQHCTAEDRNIQTVNNAYSKLMDNGSIQSLQSSALNQYSSTTEYENMKTSVLKTHSEIVPLRQELDTKLKSLMGDKASITTDYQNRYDSTMSTSLVLSVILTSSLYFIFKGL